MKYFSLISIVILLGCNKSTKSIDSNAIDSISTKVESDNTLKKESDSTTKKVEEDCVFNNDYKGLTTAWLKDLGKTNYIWMENLKSAAIRNGEDTIYLSQGGCVHFGFTVESRLHNNTHSLDDSTYWATKSLQLANDFKMEFYSNELKNRRVKLQFNSADSYWFIFEDDNFDDNLFYTGIEISAERNTRAIIISQYFN